MILEYNNAVYSANNIVTFLLFVIQVDCSYNFFAMSTNYVMRLISTVKVNKFTLGHVDFRSQMFMNKQHVLRSYRLLMILIIS